MDFSTGMSYYQNLIQPQKLELINFWLVASNQLHSLAGRLAEHHIRAIIGQLFAPISQGPFGPLIHVK